MNSRPPTHTHTLAHMHTHTHSRIEETEPTSVGSLNHPPFWRWLQSAEQQSSQGSRSDQVKGRGLNTCPHQEGGLADLEFHAPHHRCTSKFTINCIKVTICHQYISPFHRVTKRSMFVLLNIFIQFDIRGVGILFVVLFARILVNPLSMVKFTLDWHEGAQ